ncbi:S9C family peptidase [Basidiobolus meristosporus CBS 931.73]|uniref:Dipeptidyl-peptidase V n=1 Tax=Basidiobolus meristosporus CBS 931.73 TaxID=1314790 RepID=A0A1Y1YQH7_9FUNG|nr:S9C family peptidase [Basidiobolus meristosporus CBS 931.73]|eukprot:ORY00216.1 S9C family peptidase [Basidiobolus meristosporus CBS 931.73]
MKWCLFSLLAVPLASALRPITPQDLVAISKPGAAVPSPDGKWAVFSSSNYSITENSSTRNLWLLDLAKDSVTALTPSGKFGDSEPIWLDSATVGFLSSRSKSTQLWAVEVSKPNATPVQVTNFTLDIGNIKYNPNSKLLAFTTAVYDDGSMEKAVEIDAAESKRTDSALVYDQLMVRHWDAFVTKKKQNIFTARLGKNGATYSVTSSPINVMKKTGLESPVPPFGGASDYDISPDGKEIAFSAKRPGRDYAWETDINIYVVPTDGSKAPKSLTDKNLAAASSPAYSPDGKTLGWLQMERRGYESDRKRIILQDRTTKKTRYLSKNWDRTPNELIWSVDSKTLFLPSEEYGRIKVFAADTKSGRIRTVVNEHSTSSVAILNKDTLLLTQSAMNHPSEYYTVKADGSNLKQISQLHKAKVDDLYLPRPEEFWFKGAEGTKVHGWLLKPFGFKPNKKYPVAFFVHGGPQGAWMDSWSSRWNPEIFASAGYVVVAINPRGSTGYGQKFTDEVQQSWGGRPYVDLMNGLDYVLKTYNYADSKRVCGLGGSYGGYMMNWINGHTDRFKCLVNHDGKFSMLSGYYSTDELWFPESEMGGVPWDPKARKNYEKWSPSNYVQNWKTPTLIIQGAHDYRIVDGESFSTFTALQRQNIPSRLLYFPDETHWVSKPANSLRWHAEILTWLNKWAKN